MVRNGFCWSSALPCWSKSASFIVSEEYHKGRKGLAEEPPVHRREALVHVHDLRHLELPYKSVAELLRDLSGHTPPSRYLPVLVVSLSLSASLQVCASIVGQSTCAMLAIISHFAKVCSRAYAIQKNSFGA